MSTRAHLSKHPGLDRAETQDCSAVAAMGGFLFLYRSLSQSDWLLLLQLGQNT